jgi:hypothetical protein
MTLIDYINTLNLGVRQFRTKSVEINGWSMLPIAVEWVFPL